MMQQPPELPPTITFVPWANAFTPEEMDRIEGVGDVLPLAQAGLMTDIAANTRDRIRITRTAWLDSIAVNKWIYDRIQQITTMINAMSYRFELTGFSERIQYSVYHGSEGGHYDWHVDQGPLVTRRKLSLSLQLTDPLHYQGGDLQFLAGSRIETGPRDRGMLIAFPSYGVHRVSPVTAGTRKSLVIWITGPQFR
ncbi:MAG TPA: 2OG-Fe(II) oxygenase [Rhizomicrobium sp.]|nr:2OG-Fe(II) oxygenase [Rhizomicrobium sp.]